MDPNMTFPLGSLRGTPLCAKLAEECRSYSVLLSTSPCLKEGGSGTLIKYKDLCGILTATHVFADQTDVSVIYSPILKTEDSQLFLEDEIPIKELIYLETPEGIQALQGGKRTEGVLDICLVLFESSVFQSVLKLSGKKVVDLLKYKEAYLKDAEKYCGDDRNHDWCWVMDGYPREGRIQKQAGILELTFGGLYICGGSKNGRTYIKEKLTMVKPPFDRAADLSCHDLGPTRDPIPSIFGGISGAGVWQVSFSGKETPEAIDEMFFSGVCVVSKAQKCLLVKGPSALYDIFVDCLDKRKDVATSNLEQEGQRDQKDSSS